MRPYFAYCTNHKINYDRFFVFIIANKNAFYFLIIFLSQYVNELLFAWANSWRITESNR